MKKTFLSLTILIILVFTILLSKYYDYKKQYSEIKADSDER